MADQTSSNVKPYDITNIKTYVPIILDLNELNYDAWRELFQTHYIGFGVLGFLDGTSTPQGDADHEWTRLDSLVKLWIYGTISQSLLTTILKKNVTARDLWLSLENLFRDNKDSRAIQLDSDLRNLTLGNMSIGDYFHKIKSLSDLLQNIDKPVDEKTLVIYMVNGLSEKFEYVASIIRHRSPLPTLLEARSMLLAEEQRLSRPRHHTGNHRDHSSSSTVLYSGDGSSNKNSKWRGRNRGPGRGSGSHGGRTGHGRSGHGGRGIFPGPWSLPPYAWNYTGFPPYPWMFSPRNGGGHGTASHSNHNSSRRGSFNKATEAYHTTVGDHSTPWNWFPPVNDSQATNLHQAFNALSVDGSDDSQWYMDTGATFSHCV